MKKITVSDKWPEAISDGCSLPCSICHKKKVFFDYKVNDNFWQEVAPKEYRLDVICLPCLDKLATKKGLDVASYLESVQFTGIGKTVILLPSKVYYYEKG